MARTWFASDEIRILLAANGIGTLEEAMLRGEPLSGVLAPRGSKHPHKEVVRLEIDGAEADCIYIKRQRSRERYLPKLRDLLRLEPFLPDPIREWRGLTLMSQRGFCVAEPWALFTCGWLSAVSAIVTRGVPARQSLDQWLVSEDWEFLPDYTRDEMLRSVAATILDIERQKIRWRSMKPKHFYPEELADGTWRTWLLDCEGAESGATPADLERQRKRFLEAIAKLPEGTGKVAEIERRFRSGSTRKAG